MWRSWRNRDWAFQSRFSGERTTQNHLIVELYKTQPDIKCTPGFRFNPYRSSHEDINCDEVYPGIYIGDAGTAKNKNYLKSLGITHLLNAAEGKRFGFVDTDKYYYVDTTIKYLGLPLADVCSTDISKYFYTAASFIDEAISTGGKAFVHCVVGVSRSATCVLAYLMIKKGMSAIDAIRTVRSNRYVRPNDGFLQQLAQLDNQLRDNYV